MSALVETRFAGLIAVEASTLAHAPSMGAVTVETMGVVVVLFPREARELAAALLEAASVPEHRTLKRPSAVGERFLEGAG